MNTSLHPRLAGFSSKVKKVYEPISSIFMVLIRIMVTAVALLFAVLFIQIFAYQFLPMSYWVDYDSVEMLNDPHIEGQWVKVTRYVDPDENIIAVRRFVEIHEKVPNFGTVNRCVDARDQTIEFVEDPSILWNLEDFIGGCKLAFLEGRRLSITATYQIQLPYGYAKKKSFLIGPFIVTNGLLIEEERHGR